MKKLALGIVIGALLATAIPVAAEEINKKVTATVRADFAIQVDGKQIELKNSPLAYDGNSYLPVRELASLLGKNVDFKDGVILLDTPVYEVSSKEEFDASIAKLENDIERNNKLLVGIESDIAGINEQLADDPKTLDEALTVLFVKQAQYEAIVANAEQAINELKEKYPQYA